MPILGILRAPRIAGVRFSPQRERLIRWRAQIEETQQQKETPVEVGTPPKAIAEVCRLKMATLNIQDGRRNRLNAALRCMKQMEIDFGVLTETKFQNDKYTKFCEGFTVVGTATDGNKGGVALFYRDGQVGWTMESVRQFSPNVIRATLVSGSKRWYIVAAYIPPSDEEGLTLEFIAKATDTVPNQQWPIILLGDLNVDLARPEGNSAVGADRRFETAALISTLGLVSMRGKFRQRRKRLNRFWTWISRRRDGRRYGAICDHIASDDPSCFTNCQIVEPRFDTDHFGLVARIRLASKQQHRRYAKSRSKYPIPKLKPGDMNQADKLLTELTEAVTAKKKTNGRDNSWISDRTWKLIDRRADARKSGSKALIRALSRCTQRALRDDRKARAEAAADAACALLNEGKIREAFGAIKGWYRDVGPRPPKPSREEINFTGAEYENLFSEEEPVGDPIPIRVDAVDINDDPPTEEEVVASLFKLKNHKAAGASGITADKVKEWYHAARPTKEGVIPDAASVALWEKVMELMQLAFRDGVIPRDFCNGILVLIPKSDPGQYRGIALLEILYKLVSSIINRRIGSKIEFDDAIHGFRPGRGTGTAIMEAKLLAQMRRRTDEPLFLIFLDLKKAYDTLDRDQAMRILEGYGVGRNIRRIIRSIWDGDTMIPRQAGYYGKAFKARRGVRQGDIVSPLIFNIMVDAVVRNWRHVQQPHAIDDLALFYADDGMISGTDPDTVQASLDLMTRDFRSIGLKMNAVKTEYMIMAGGKRVVQLSSRAFNRMQTGVGLTQRERAMEKIICPECGVQVSRQYLKNHLKTQKCMKARQEYTPATPIRDQIEAQNHITPVLEPTTYRISVPARHQHDIECPVASCEYLIEGFQGNKRGLIRKHFQKRHVEDTIVVREEGQLPRCNGCGLFSRVANTQAHLATRSCKDGTVKRQLLRRAKLQEQAQKVVFKVDGRDLKRSHRFKYLGRILDEDDDDEHAALRQLHRAREKWGRLGAVLRGQNASARTRGYFYKAIIQAVLLYGSETWTISERVLKLFRSFHHRVARHLTGRHIRQRDDGSWFCPPTADVLNRAGLETIDEYIRRRRETVRNFVRPRPLYQACIQSRALSTNVHRVVWWQLN